MKEIKGYVVGKTQGFYEVKSNDKVYMLKLKGALKKKNDKLNCIIGDNVEFNDDVIEKIYDRKNYLTRPLIANIDDVALVYAIKDPKFDLTSFQKNLLWIDSKGVNRVLILSKIDLVKKEELEEFLKNLSNIFKDLQIFPISLKENIGTNQLKEFLIGKNIVLSGLSGVGKSSLVNYLMDTKVMSVDTISKKTKKGKNTTIITKYFENKGICIFDTPGYSSIEVPPFKDKREPMHWFNEFSEYIGKCRFRDCLHINEPCCSIKKAVEDGCISKTRYLMYTSIITKEDR